MKQRLLFFLILLILSQQSGWTQNSIDDFFMKTEAFFTGRILEGKIDTNKLILNEQQLNHLLFQLDSLNLSNYDAATQEAILLNAHKLFVINEIVQGNFPSQTSEFRKFLEEPKHFLNGTPLSLNAIRNDFLLGAYGDERILLATGIATRGDGPIYEHAFFPDSLDRQLETLTINMMQDAHFIRVKTKSNYLLLPELMKDYMIYFGGNLSGLVRFVNVHRPGSSFVPSNYKVAFYPHSWKLNCVPIKPNF